MDKKILGLALIVAAPLFAPSSALAVRTIFSDDFTVTANAADANAETPGVRQSGELASSDFYTGQFGDVQVGNSTVDVGQPGGTSNSNFLLLDAGPGSGGNQTGVQTSIAIDESLARGGPLTIKFDMYNTVSPDDATYWGAFILRANANWPIAGDGEFGLLWRANGGLQMFQSQSDDGTYDTPGTFSDPHWEMTLTDTAKTGSAFEGNGSVLLMKNGAGVVNEVALNQLNSTGLHLGILSYGEPFAEIPSGVSMGLDNLVIEGIDFTPGDADGNTLVEFADFELIRDNMFSSPAVRGTMGDLTYDGVVDGADFRQWKQYYVPESGVAAAGVTPEPTSIAMALVMAMASLGVARSRS